MERTLTNLRGVVWGDRRLGALVAIAAAVAAPSKSMIVLDTSGHRPPFEQPEAFAAAIRETVLDQAA